MASFSQPCITHTPCHNDAWLQGGPAPHHSAGCSSLERAAGAGIATQDFSTPWFPTSRLGALGPRDGPWEHDGAKAQGKMTVVQKMGCNWEQVSALVRSKDYTVSVLLQAMNLSLNTAVDGCGG